MRTDTQKLNECVPERYFDALLFGLGLMYMPDPESALVAMARCLRPNGRLAVSVWGERQACGWAGIFPIVDARVRSEVCPMFFRVGTGDTLSRALHSAGLVDLQISTVPTELNYADAACDAVLLAGPVALAYSRFDEPTRLKMRADYLASIERGRQGKRFVIPGMFVIGSGRWPA